MSENEHDRQFIMPPIVQVDNYSYSGCRSYSEYNYLRPGWASKFKIAHFKMALKLAKEIPKESSVIDFGCCDGVFLPTLSRYFDDVVGLDLRPEFIEMAKIVVKDASNVKAIATGCLSISDIQDRLGKKYDLMFILEVLEHVGDRGNQYPSRMKFLKEISVLADRAIITIPKMTGASFLMQRAGFRCLGVKSDKMTTGQLLKAGFFSDTQSLDARWNHGHIGFNDKLFEKTLKENFKIIKRKKDLFQNGYLIEL